MHVRECLRLYCVSQKENKFIIYGSFNLKRESQEVKCRKDNYNHNIVVIQWVFVMAGVLYDYGRQNGWQWGQVTKRGDSISNNNTSISDNGKRSKWCESARGMVPIVGS